jgi:uncharacterized membrane protein HdeD (DUF308 family)
MRVNMMNTTYEISPIADLGRQFASLRGNWVWFVLLGVAMIVLGTVALGAVPIASLATTLMIGVLLLGSGAAEIVGAFWCRAWSGFLLHLLSGVLSVVVGALFLRAPGDALLALTLLLVCLLTTGGVFKIVAALFYRFGAWGWLLVSGIIDFILGLMIWQEWPASALWVIGLFVGISLVFRGFHWIGLGVALRSLPGTETA